MCIYVVIYVNLFHWPTPCNQISGKPCGRRGKKASSKQSKGPIECDVMGNFF